VQLQIPSVWNASAYLTTRIREISAAAPLTARQQIARGWDEITDDANATPLVAKGEDKGEGRGKGTRPVIAGPALRPRRPSPTRPAADVDPGRSVTQSMRLRGPITAHVRWQHIQQPTMSTGRMWVTGSAQIATGGELLRETIANAVADVSGSCVL
jgi:hypothetical protein